MKHARWWWFCLCLFGAWACSSSSNGNGGNTPAGSGGSAPGAGSGAVAGNNSGSASGHGAVTNASGGSVANGSGGTTLGSGGTSVANAGKPGAAGTIGGGGTPSTGTAGSAQAGKGSSQPPPADAMPSAGCGMPAPMAGNLKIDVMGTSRDYILALPANYDPMKAYKLIFAWHGLGGSAQQVASNWYGLKTMSANGAIFVAGQGLQTMTPVGNGAGWANTNGQDVAFVKALYAQLQGQLCFDQHRVFSVGMSYGGIMSDTLGCQMGDVFRAIAPMSGSGPGYGGRATCVGQVAVWLSNGDNDMVVSTMQERASKDFWVSANHCQTQSMPVDPSPCVAFQGCDAGYPVTWCEFMGGHTVPPFAAQAIWTFFSQF